MTASRSHFGGDQALVCPLKKENETDLNSGGGFHFVLLASSANWVACSLWESGTVCLAILGRLAIKPAKSLLCAIFRGPGLPSNLRDMSQDRSLVRLRDRKTSRRYGRSCELSSMNLINHIFGWNWPRLGRATSWIIDSTSP